MGNPTPPLLTGWEITAKAFPCPRLFSHLKLGMSSRLLWGQGESLWVALSGAKVGRWDGVVTHPSLSYLGDKR